MPQILVETANYRLPYSKGILTRSLTRAGLNPKDAYEIAHRIEKDLEKMDRKIISGEELQRIVYNMLLREKGESVARKYQDWQEISHLKEPIIILIGGATGVGKSTIAAEIAHKIGIRHVVGTDTIREVMRRILSEDLVPTLHKSTYTAWEALDTPVPPRHSKIILGFEEHAKTVAVGIKAVIERALVEGISLVVEGAHIVPGYLTEYLHHPNVTMAVITLDDVEAHKERLYARSRETQTRRGAETYIKSLAHIRSLHQSIVEQAKLYQVPIIKNTSMEESVEQLSKLVIQNMAKLLRKAG